MFEHLEMELSPEKKTEKYGSKIKELLKHLSMMIKDDDEEPAMGEESEMIASPMSEESSSDDIVEEASSGDDDMEEGLSKEEIAELLKSGNEMPKPEGLKTAFGGKSKGPAVAKVMTQIKVKKGKKG